MSWASKVLSAVEARKESIGAVKDLLTICALFVGGYWTWMLYREFREAYPQLSIEQSVTFRRLSTDKVLAVVDVGTTNTGRTLIKPLVGWFAVDQILPLTDEQLGQLKPGQLRPRWGPLRRPDWFVGLGPGSQRQLEPGESETQHVEVILDGGAKTVRIYSFFVDPRSSMTPKSPGSSQGVVGWERMSVHDLQEPAAVSGQGTSRGVPGHSFPKGRGPRTL